jgi:dihydrodipicolinate synthase/N-acetylneuraminate lyase
VTELCADAMAAWRNGNLHELARIQQQIGKIMAIYSLGNDFITTIKTAVSRRFNSMTSYSRNFVGELTAEQCAKIDELFV